MNMQRNMIARIDDSQAGGKDIIPGLPLQPYQVVSNPKHLDDQQLFLHHCLYNLPNLETWNETLPDFPNRELTRKNPEGDHELSITFKTDSARAVMEGTWGCVYIEDGSETPSQFDAKCTEYHMNGRRYFRITDLVFRASAALRMRPFSSKDWVSGWKEQNTIQMGRGPLSPKERKYWALAHEMDHFVAYHEFWQFMVAQVFQAVNTKYSSQAECDNKITEIRFNNLINHRIARARSNVFDNFPRGIPQKGSRLHTIKFKEEENFHWTPFSTDLENKLFTMVKKENCKLLQTSYINSLRALKIGDELGDQIQNIMSDETRGIEYLRAKWEDLAQPSEKQ